MLFATMFCYLFFYLGHQTFGFAIPGIQAELGLSKQQLGWISAAMLWAYALGQAINGNLADKYGGRRAMTAGAVLSCATNWIVSFSIGFWSMLIPWGVNGYFQALGWAPGSRLLTNWWGADERGKMYGLYLLSSGAAAVLAFVSSTIVIDVLHLDWRWMFRFPVLLMLLGGAIFFLTVRDTPQELRFKSPHDSKDAVTPGSDQCEETSFQRYKAVVSNRGLAVAGVTIGFANAARYGLIIWVPVHYLEKGTSVGGAASGQRWTSIALPLGMAIGAVSNGWISDRVFGSRRGKTVALYMLLAIVASLSMYSIPASQVALSIATLFLCGFFVFGPYASLFALCPDLVGVKRAGTATGMLNFYSYLFAGLLVPAFGIILDRHSDTSNVFLAVAVACAVSFVAALLIRR